MDQPLARLAFILFDPRSDDGFMAWNILDPMLGGHARAGVLSGAPDHGGRRANPLKGRPGAGTRAPGVGWDARFVGTMANESVGNMTRELCPK